MTQRVGAASRPMWLCAALVILLCTDIVSGVPTRVLPDRHHNRNDASLDSQSLSASVLLQEHETLSASHQTHSHSSSQHTSAASATEELDFSLLNSLIPAESHAELRKRKADTLTEDDIDWHHATSSLLEVNERARTEASTAAKARMEAAEDLRMGTLNFAKAGTAATLGGMRVQEVDSVTNKAVQSALRLVGFDRPIEDEKPLNLYGDTISERNFDQRDVLLGHDHRPSGSADPSYMDPMAGVSEAALLERAAAARQHVRDAQGDLAFTELEARIDRKSRDRSNAQHLSPSSDQRASTPPAPGATILTEEKASTGIPSALSPLAEQAAAGKMPSRGGKQPSSAELLNFLKEHLPSTSMIHPGANFRFRSKHEARVGEDGGEEGGDGGLAYKPSPFKHPPPPPVPPPPPPPPPPNFGPGSQFSGYSFGGEGGGGEGGGGGGEGGGGGGGDDGGGGGGGGGDDSFASVYERARMRDPAAAQRAAAAEQHLANGPQELGISMLEVDSKQSSQQHQQQHQQAGSDPYSAHRAHELEAEFAHFPTSGFNEEYFDANYDHWQHAYGYQYPPYYQALHEQYAAYFQQYGQPPHWDAYGGFAGEAHQQPEHDQQQQEERTPQPGGADSLLEDYERAAQSAFASAGARASV